MNTTTSNSSGFTINSTGNIGLGGTSQSTNGFHITSSQSPRASSITPVANGYSVSIGCQTFVFESLANLLYRIEEYYTNPSSIEEHFMQNKTLPVILSKKNKN
jgi:hypothetical protein